MAKLIVISGDERQEFELAAFNTIGRHPDNTIQILDRIISKEHAQIQRAADGRFLLRDLRSLNGTFMRGERIADHYLSDGDEFTMGSTRIVFVDKPKTDDVLQRVTIAPGLTESHIRGRIQANTGDFMPERQIADDKNLRRDYERLRIGHELARAVGSELDLDKLLPKILDKAFELVGCDRGVILLVDDRGELVPRYVKTRSGKSDSEHRAVEDGVGGGDDQPGGGAVVGCDDGRAVLRGALDHHAGDPVDDDPAAAARGRPARDHAPGLAVHVERVHREGPADLHRHGGAGGDLDPERAAGDADREGGADARADLAADPAVGGGAGAQGRADDREGRPADRGHDAVLGHRGFTTMSDGRPPQEIVNTLNEYFEVMVDILFKYSGTLDKFVGDEIIGLFGAPIAIDDAPFKAVACALAMLQGLEEFNRTRAAENQAAIRIGIGINTGNVITGSIGSTRALQYTAIGDAMNVASRLVNVAGSGEIIVSEDTYRYIAAGSRRPRCRRLKVKGKAEELKVYRITGLRKLNTPLPGEWTGPTNH